MSRRGMMCRLYEYNGWANGVILDAAGDLSPEELAEAKTASHERATALLVHTLGTQVFWLTRWKGEAFPTQPLVQAERMLESLREGFAASDGGMSGFVGGVAEDDLDRPTAMPEFVERMKGVELPLWQVMMQIVEHGIHHRAEVQSSLTGLGHPVQDLDYIIWEIDRKRARG